MPKRKQHALARLQKQMVKRRTEALTEADKQALLDRFRRLNVPTRTFVSEIFARAKEARGRLDDDVYGVLYATLEALKHTGGMPPALVFGVSHYQTGKVEQVGFMPDGLKELPPGGKLITNHPAFTPEALHPLATLPATAPSCMDRAAVVISEPPQNTRSTPVETCDKAK